MAEAESEFARENFLGFASVADKDVWQTKKYSNNAKGSEEKKGFDSKTNDSQDEEEVWNKAKAALLESLALVVPDEGEKAKLIEVADALSSGSSNDSQNEVNLHEAIFQSTTAALQRLIFYVCRTLTKKRGSAPTLLTTDFEYPGIITAIDEIWEGPVFFLKAAQKIDEGDTGGEVAELIRSAINFCKPDALLVSHVERRTGYTFTKEDLKKITRGDDADGPVVILDGSQALGNAVFDLEEVKDSGVNFYAASGHKFLCSMPTIGVAFCTNRPKGNRWKVRHMQDTALGYSIRKGGGATGSIQSMSSLANGIENFCSGSSEDKEKAVREIWQRAKEVVEDKANGEGLKVLDFGKSRNSGILAVSLEGEGKLEAEDEEALNGATVLNESDKKPLLEEGIPSSYPRAWLYGEEDDHLYGNEEDHSFKIYLDDEWWKDREQMKSEEENEARYDVLRISLHHAFHHVDSGANDSDRDESDSNEYSPLHGRTVKAIEEAVAKIKSR